MDHQQWWWWISLPMSFCRWTMISHPILLHLTTILLETKNNNNDERWHPQTNSVILLIQGKTHNFDVRKCPIRKDDRRERRIQGSLQVICLQKFKRLRIFSNSIINTCRCKVGIALVFQAASSWDTIGCILCHLSKNLNKNNVTLAKKKLIWYLDGTYRTVPYRTVPITIVTRSVYEIFCLAGSKSAEERRFCIKYYTRGIVLFLPKI